MPIMLKGRIPPQGWGDSFWSHLVASHQSLWLWGSLDMHQAQLRGMSLLQLLPFLQCEGLQRKIDTSCWCGTKGTDNGDAPAINPSTSQHSSCANPGRSPGRSSGTILRDSDRTPQLYSPLTSQGTRAMQTCSPQRRFRRSLKHNIKYHSTAQNQSWPFHFSHKGILYILINGFNYW